jgi:DNA-binding response OmpR family regulator
MIKILIIEDDTSIAKLYETKFSKENFEVIMASDGKAGAHAALEHQPDIILLDLNLPILNGFEVLQKIRKNIKTKEIPVVILTNYGEVDNITECFLKGATEFMVKVEHTPEEVVDTVREVLDVRGSIITKAFKESEHKH